MSVHIALSKHVNGLSKIIKEFSLLEQQREAEIEKVCSRCRDGKDFSTDTINKITKQMNLLSTTIENLPKRKYVSTQMVKDYVDSRKK